MNEFEHEAFMELLEKKKRSTMIFIGALLLAFAVYFIFIRPLLKAYI